MEKCGDQIFEPLDKEIKQHYRSLFISDLHIGTKAFMANRFINFLKEHKFDNLYIVGDFIDLWKLKRGIYWPQAHTDVMRKILKISKKHKVVYITGNHDEAIEDFAAEYGNIEICRTHEYITLQNKRILVIHGDQFDFITKHAKWLSKLGDIGYTMLLSTNGICNWVRKKLGKPYWSLSNYMKVKTKSVINIINNYEDALVRYAMIEKFDGVICGHIHQPAIKNIRGIEYYNCGDWVETCTAIAEDHDGNLIQVVYGPDYD